MCSTQKVFPINEHSLTNSYEDIFYPRLDLLSIQAWQLMDFLYPSVLTPNNFRLSGSWLFSLTRIEMYLEDLVMNQALFLCKQMLKSLDHASWSIPEEALECFC